MSDASRSPKNDASKSAAIPLFKSGDIGGVVYAFAGNIGNFIFVAYVLLGFGWPKELVFDKVIPGISLGLMLQSFYYQPVEKVRSGLLFASQSHGTKRFGENVVSPRCSRYP